MSSTPISGKHCFRVTVCWKEMDMSGGDNIDGPCWTGGYVDARRVVHIVAPTAEIAGAAAVASHYGHEKAVVESVEAIAPVYLVLLP